MERVLNRAVIFEIDDFANVKLLNPNDFKEFCIQCSDTRSAIEICEILELVQQGNKVIDEKHLWLCSELVRELAPNANKENWEKGFTKMIDYATSNGWTENNGTLIRAHIE